MAPNPFAKCRSNKCEIYEECKQARAKLWTGAERIAFIVPRRHGNLWGLVLTLGEFIRDTSRESVYNNDAWECLLGLSQPLRLAVEVAVLVRLRPEGEGGYPRKQDERTQEWESWTVYNKRFTKDVLSKLGMSFETFRYLACTGLQEVIEKLGLQPPSKDKPPASSLRVSQEVKKRKKFTPLILER